MDKELLAKYAAFAADKLGLEFHDINLLVTALTHRSYVNEHQTAHFEHNERLEFLGDAVLELVVSDFLYRNFYQPEGIMTAWRAALVCTDSIGAAGETLNYAPLIRLSKGEQHNTERARATIVADCFEALIGAIFLDQGYAVAQEFISRHILSKIDEVLASGAWRPAKSYLQELSQHFDETIPSYRVLKEQGPDHDKSFKIGVYIGKTLKGTGVGHNKQDAQTAAARAAIKVYLADHPEIRQTFDRVQPEN